MLHNNFRSSLFLSSLSSFGKRSDNGSSDNIYLGIGVCARGSLSKAIPFDILSLILCAEAMRRQLNSKQVFYIIADTHAVLTGHDPSKVMDYALRLSAILDNIFSSWNIPHTNYLASFINDIDYHHALSSADNTRYMLAEIEDMYYFAQKYKVGFKLGWKYVARAAEKKGFWLR